MKLTKKQWERLLARVFEREGKKLEEAAPLVFQHEPATERILGRLYQYIGPRGEPIPVAQREALPGVRRRTLHLPIEEARRRYFENPELYEPFTASMRARVLRRTPEGVTYDWERIQSILPAPLKRAKRLVERETGGEAPVRRVLETAMEADILWRDVGAAETLGKKMWERLWKSSRLKSRFKAAKDYFTWCFTQWKMNPKEFARKHPREAKLIESYWKALREELE